MALVKDIYRVTKRFPDEEKFGLAIQIRRAAISIPSNIAEGHIRQTTKEFKQFIAIARGSCAELQTQLMLAGDLGYFTQESEATLLQDTEILAKMLSSFYGKL